MARTSYDDWNFMGEVHKDESRYRSAHSAKTRQITIQILLQCNKIAKE